VTPQPPRADAPGPLAGIRILDFTRVVAGPYATMALGDLGAEIIKVEEPRRGDDCRAWGPPSIGADSAYFLGLNRNKRSIGIDLSTAEGVSLAKALARRCDVVVENFRPGVMPRLGLDYASLQADHPALVYCSISAFGQSGPYRDWAGYDVMVSALGGLMGITGQPGGEPVKVGVALVDVATGLYAALGITAAVGHAKRTGQGQRVDTSLLAVELSILINAASSYLLASEVLTPQGSAHSSIVPYQAFRAADGWIVVGAANDKLFRLLAAELGHPQWASDERFSTNVARVANRDQLIGLIGAQLATKPRSAWLEMLGPAGVAVAPVNRIDEVFEDPRVQQLDPIVNITHPRYGNLRLVRPALEMSVTPTAVVAPPPELGGDTAAVLADVLGIGQAEYERLKTSGVLGQSESAS
jgi:crotonobetainyl-CoA:carnitine CoA-transferase CaiB-like acyl-CoA transferase